MSVLVDTSVWVDALNGRKTRQVKLLEHMIDEDTAIVICPTIIQEILQGIKDDKEFEQVKENLSGFDILSIDPLEAAYGAATLYRTARKKGMTIRKSNDCLIAYCAIHAKAALLHNDGDFDKLARCSPLKILN